MRFVVFLLGIIAVIITSSVGYFYFEDSLFVNIRAFSPPELLDYVMPLTGSPLGWPNGDTGVFVLLCGAYGLLGVLMAFARRGWQGGLLLIVPPLVTAAMNPNTLAFTGFQIFVGLLAFLVFRLPIEEPKVKSPEKPKERLRDADMEDEWSQRGGSKSKTKSKRNDDDDD